MPVNRTRENEVREQVEREFSDMEQVARLASVGVLDILEVYGGLEGTLHQADAYLALLNPVSASFSTTSSSNIQA